MDYQSLFNTQSFYGDTINCDDIETTTIRTDYINENTVDNGVVIQSDQIPIRYLLGDHYAVFNNIGDLTLTGALISNEVITGSLSVGVVIIGELSADRLSVNYIRGYDTDDIIFRNDGTITTYITINSLTGLITTSGYSAGLLKATLPNGEIISALLVDTDVTTNTLSLAKLAQIANNKILGNISGITANVQLVDTSTSSTANTIMLRNASGNSDLKTLNCNSVQNLDNAYVFVKNISFYDNEIRSESSSDFYIYNDNAGVFLIKNNVGDMYLASETADVNLITYGISGIIKAWNDFHCPAPFFVDQINEESVNNGVNIDGVLCKDGGITISSLIISPFGVGVIHSNGVGLLSSSLIVNADITTGTVALNKLASGTSAQIIVCNGSGVPTYTGMTGDITISNAGVSAIGTGVIVNADVNASAAISVSKLAAGTAGQVLLNNATPTPTWTSMSGNATISNTGILTISNNVITNAMVNSAAAIAYSKLNLSNSIVNGDLTSLCVASGNLQDSSVTTAKIADLNVTSGKIANLAVATGKIANNAVTYAKIQQVAANSILGNISGSSANVSEISATSLPNANSIVVRDSGGGVDFSNIELYREGGNPFIYSYFARAGPSQTLANDSLFNHRYFAYDNTGTYRQNAQLIVASTDNVTSTAQGGQFQFHTVPVGGVGSSQRAKLDSNGFDLNIPVSTTSSITALSASITNTATIATANITTGNITTANITTSNNTNTNNSGVILNSNATLSNPSYSFTGNVNTGMYRPGTNRIGFAANGTLRGEVNTTGFYSPSFSLDNITYLGGVFAGGSLSLSLSDGLNSFTGVSCNGSFVRMFTVVHYFFSITWTGKGAAAAGSAVQINNFPYSFNTGNSISSNIANLAVTYTNFLTIAGNASNNYAGIWNQRSGLTDVAITVGGMPTSGTFYCQLTAYV